MMAAPSSTYESADEHYRPFRVTSVVRTQPRTGLNSFLSLIVLKDEFILVNVAPKFSIGNYA